jgi:hypothetical protein
MCVTSVPQGIGMAIKVTDGNWRRLAPAVIKVLRDLDVFPDPVAEALRPHERLPVLGGEVPQGWVEAVVRLRTARERASRS